MRQHRTEQYICFWPKLLDPEGWRCLNVVFFTFYCFWAVHCCRATRIISGDWQLLRTSPVWLRIFLQAWPMRCPAWPMRCPAWTMQCPAWLSCCPAWIFMLPFWLWRCPSQLRRCLHWLMTCPAWLRRPSWIMMSPAWLLKDASILAKGESSLAQGESSLAKGESSLAAAMSWQSLLPVHEDVAWLDVAAQAHQGQALVFTPGIQGCSVGCNFIFYTVWDNKAKKTWCAMKDKKN